MATLTHALQRAIRESGQSITRISREAGVVRQNLSKFMRGEQTLTLRTADKLIAQLGSPAIDAAKEDSDS